MRYWIPVRFPVCKQKWSHLPKLRKLSQFFSLSVFQFAKTENWKTEKRTSVTTKTETRPFSIPVCWKLKNWTTLTAPLGRITYWLSVITQVFIPIPTKSAFRNFKSALKSSRFWKLHPPSSVWIRRRNSRWHEMNRIGTLTFEVPLTNTAGSVVQLWLFFVQWHPPQKRGGGWIRSEIPCRDISPLCACSSRSLKSETSRS